jgi:hypothetical protein
VSGTVRLADNLKEYLEVRRSATRRAPVSVRLASWISLIGMYAIPVWLVYIGVAMIPALLAGRGLGPFASCLLGIAGASRSATQCVCGIGVLSALLIAWNSLSIEVRWFKGARNFVFAAGWLLIAVVQLDVLATPGPVTLPANVAELLGSQWIGIAMIAIATFICSLAASLSGGHIKPDPPNPNVGPRH